jgi:vacuolar protein sorting-associated protein 33A
VSHAGSGQRRLVVVMFIGGVTFAEVAALRWLSRRPDVNSDFLVCTTKLVSGSSLLSSCIDDSVLASMAQAQIM